jgi:hypothetical protein
MAFATEAFSDVNPFGGFGYGLRRFRGALVGAAAIGAVTASLAWIVVTLATMQTMGSVQTGAISLSPNTNNLARVALVPRAILSGAEVQGQRLIHVAKFSRLHPLLTAEQQALNDALDVAKGNRANARRKLAAAVVQNALKVALADAAARPVINAAEIAAATDFMPRSQVASATPDVANEKPVDVALVGSTASLTESATAIPQPASTSSTPDVGPMEKAVGVALADAASPVADDGFMPPVPSARPTAAGTSTQTTSVADNLSTEDPFNLVMANRVQSSDEDPLDSVPLPASRPRSPAEDRFRRPAEHVLAYAKADDGMTDDAPTFNNAISLPGGHNRVAVYDISAGTVYLPSGEKLEAHSGMGNMIDNPRYVSQHNRGPTPPSTYGLTLRESLFHGVQALRLTPVGGNVYGRTGLLAHTYMLGRRGDSNGCVVFKDYRRFLAAYQRGEVTRMVVVPRLSGSSTRVASR